MSLTIVLPENMQTEGASAKDHVFTSSKYGTFNVTKLQQWVDANKVAAFHISSLREVVDKVLAQIDLDPERLEELRKVPSEQMKPAMACIMGDGTCIIVDGYHRLRVLTDRQSPMKSYFVPWEVTRKSMVRHFIITDDGRRELAPCEVLAATWGRYSKPEKKMNG